MGLYPEGGVSDYLYPEFKKVVSMQSLLKEISLLCPESNSILKAETKRQNEIAVVGYQHLCLNIGNQIASGDPHPEKQV